MLLFGASKLGVLKILKMSARNFRLNRSVNLMDLAKAISVRDWNGARKLFRPALPKPVSVRSSAGIPLAALGTSIFAPKALGLRTGLATLILRVPCKVAVATDPVGANGRIGSMIFRSPKIEATAPEKSITL